MLIDEQLFQSMKVKMNKRFSLIVEVFFEESEEIITQLKVAGGSGDCETMIRSVHSLKSSSASLGAQQLSTLAATFEALYNAGDISHWKDDWDSLNTLYLATKEAMKSLNTIS